VSESGADVRRLSARVKKQRCGSGAENGADGAENRVSREREQSGEREQKRRNWSSQQRGTGHTGMRLRADFRRNVF